MKGSIIVNMYIFRTFFSIALFPPLAQMDTVLRLLTSDKSINQDEILIIKFKPCHRITLKALDCPTVYIILDRRSTADTAANNAELGMSIQAAAVHCSRQQERFDWLEDIWKASQQLQLPITPAPTTIRLHGKHPASQKWMQTLAVCVHGTPGRSNSNNTKRLPAERSE